MPVDSSCFSQIEEAQKISSQIWALDRRGVSRSRSMFEAFPVKSTCWQSAFSCSAEGPALLRDGSISDWLSAMTLRHLLFICAVMCLWLVCSRDEVSSFARCLLFAFVWGAIGFWAQGPGVCPQLKLLDQAQLCRNAATIQRESIVRNRPARSNLASWMSRFLISCSTQCPFNGSFCGMLFSTTDSSESSSCLLRSVGRSRVLASALGCLSCFFGSILSVLRTSAASFMRLQTVLFMNFGPPWGLSFAMPRAFVWPIGEGPLSPFKSAVGVNACKQKTPKEIIKKVTTRILFVGFFAIASVIDRPGIFQAFSNEKKVSCGVPAEIVRRLFLILDSIIKTIIGETKSLQLLKARNSASTAVPHSLSSLAVSNHVVMVSLSVRDAHVLQLWLFATVVRHWPRWRATKHIPKRRLHLGTREMDEGVTITETQRQNTFMGPRQLEAPAQSHRRIAASR